MISINYIGTELLLIVSFLLSLYNIKFIFIIYLLISYANFTATFNLKFIMPPHILFANSQVEPETNPWQLHR